MNDLLFAVPWKIRSFSNVSKKTAIKQEQLVKYWTICFSAGLRKLYKDYREKRTCAQIRMLDKPRCPNQDFNKHIWLLTCSYTATLSKQLTARNPYNKTLSRLLFTFNTEKKTQTWFFRCQRKGESGYTQKNSVWFVIVCSDKGHVMRKTGVNLAKTQSEKHWCLCGVTNITVNDRWSWLLTNYHDELFLKWSFFIYSFLGSCLPNPYRSH